MAKGETHHQRVNRELIELLNELRVVLPGVQVLFAFLLSLPFLARFDQLSSVERDVYFVSFLCAAAATALLIAPSAYHRLRFRQHDKERMLFTSASSSPARCSSRSRSWVSSSWSPTCFTTRPPRP